MSLIRDEMKAWVDSTEWKDTWTEEVIVGSTTHHAKITNAIDGIDFTSGGFEIKTARKFRFARVGAPSLTETGSITYAGERYRVIQISPDNGSPVFQVIGAII